MGSPSIAEINPKTSLNGIEDDDFVSFIPMEAVAEKINAFTHTPRPLSEVRKGYTCFQDNDVLWAKITPCMQNGKAAVVHGLTRGVGFGSTEFHVLRAKVKALSGFLWAVLSMPRLLYAAQGAFTGSSGHQRVPASFLEQLEIPVPPIDIQRRLVAELDVARAERDRALTEANELETTSDSYLMLRLGLKISEDHSRKTFAVRLRDVRGSRIDPPAYQPLLAREASPIVPIKHLADCVSINCNVIQRPESDEEMVPYVGLPECDHTSIRDVILRPYREVKGRAVIKPGDVLFARIEPSIFNKKYILVENLKGFDFAYTSTEFYVVTPIPSVTLAEYVHAMFSCSFVYLQSKGMTAGSTGRRRLDAAQFRTLRFPLPSIDIQREISDEALRRRAEARRLRSQAETSWQQARERFEQQLLKGDAA